MNNINTTTAATLISAEGGITTTNVNNRRHHHHSSRRNRRSLSHRNRHQQQQHNHTSPPTFQIYTTTVGSSSSSDANRPTTSSNATSQAMNNIRLMFSSGNGQKKTERNLLAATCSIFCIAILAVSLIEIRWFYLNGGGCNVNYLGAAHFFSPGRLQYQLELSKVTKSEVRVYTFTLSNGLELRNCANREIMLIMRTCIAFVFLAVFSACCGLMLDTFGSMRPGVRMLRRNAVFHIITVVFCLVVNGLCFWMSEKMNDQQNETRTKKGKKIEVSFDVSYYLIVIAGGLSILATAFTLIRRYPSDEDEQLERLLEEYTGFEEPIHLERSLPAPLPPPPSSLSSSSLCCSHNTNEQLINLALPTLPTPPPPPLPPSTPPPSLLINSNTSRSIVEPPPPYHHSNSSDSTASTVLA